MIQKETDLIECYKRQKSKTPAGCAAKAFEDYDGATPWKVKAVNTGVCETPSEYATIYDGIAAASENVMKQGCRRCCIDIDHGGAWRAEMMITSDGSDPWYMDCRQANKKYACKSNEHGTPYCEVLRSVHDEM